QTTRTSRTPPVTPTTLTSDLSLGFMDRTSRDSGVSGCDLASELMMTRKNYPQITQIVLLLLCNLWITGSAVAQTDRWIDSAPVDYDILPNVTYAKANNLELKLDLYL